MLTGADSDKDQVNQISSKAQMVRSSLLKVSGFSLIFTAQKKNLQFYSVNLINKHLPSSKLILWSFGKSLDTAQTFKFDIEY